MFNKLKNLIMELVIDLKKSGKQDTANFFMSINNKIENTNNREELKEIFNQLMSSASIIQYGDFSFKQEEIFNKIFTESRLCDKKL